MKKNNGKTTIKCEKYLLDDVAQFLKGTGLSKDKLDVDGKNKCILYGELYTKYNEVIENIVSRTNSNEGILSKKGDVLFPASTTTVGEDLANATVLNEDNVLLGGDIIILRCNGCIVNSTFLAFYLTHCKKREIARLTQGTTIIHLYGSSLKKLAVQIPPITYQEKVSEILLKVNKDIEKTEEIIKKTIRMRNGLMQELFARGIGHKEFKETKLGMIPKEWEIKQFQEVADISRGKFSHRPRNDKKFYGGVYPFIQTGNVVNCNGRVKKYSQTLNEKGLSVSRIFKKGTIVLTIAANIGDTGILEFDSCFPDSLVGINAKEGMSNIFLEFYLRTRKKYFNSIATQSAQKNINLEKLNPALIIKPPLKEQEKLADILLKIDKKIEICKKNKSKLKLLKKGLMQDLLKN